jgi:hypothetical protein
MIRHAHWIWSSEATHAKPSRPTSSPYDVRLFRREFDCGSDPSAARLRIEVSADSRYVLWLNGVVVARGPAKGDVRHHFFDTIDPSSRLVAGRNVLAAVVLDMSTVAHRPDHLGAPCSVMTYAGGFVLGGRLEDGAGRTLEDVSTDPRWKVAVDEAHGFQNLGTRFEGYHGYFEERFSAREPTGWRLAGFDDTGWEPATVLYRAELAEERRDPASPYGLLPRIIPMLEEGEETPFAHTFSQTTDPETPPDSTDPETTRCFPLRVPPSTTLRLIFDVGETTTAFPVLRIAQGTGASVRLTYAEALRLPWDTPGARLLGRKQSLANLASHFADESTGWTFDPRGTISGWCDVWHPSGVGSEESFEPLHWRAFRYVGLEITTGSEPLELRSFAHRFCAYPYDLARSGFSCSDARLDRIWEISLRTMRLCSHETFEDCVHYEQMQYAGDTMITSRLGMATTGDCRLSRQALLHFDWSRIHDGLTQSRYPSRLVQVIPSWSLHWITTIRDYLLMSGDATTTRGLLHGIDAVLEWFRRHRDASGLPARLPFWNTADWCPTWQRGQPPGWDTGPTCVIASQFVAAIDDAATIHRLLGDSDRATMLTAEADRMRPILHATFWSEKEGLYFDRPGGPETSQYGNAWAVVAGAADSSTRARLLRRFPNDPALATVSFFGWHTIFSALESCGAYDTMPDHLQPWHEMVAHGLSTWAEENTYWRSLCHAWTAHPAIEFLARVLGVRPLTPGFAETEIRPRLCGLQHASGAVCTPHGPVRVEWIRRGRTLDVRLETPASVLARVVAPDGRTHVHHGGPLALTWENCLP